MQMPTLRQVINHYANEIGDTIRDIQHRVESSDIQDFGQLANERISQFADGILNGYFGEENDNNSNAIFSSKNYHDTIQHYGIGIVGGLIAGAVQEQINHALGSGSKSSDYKRIARILGMGALIPGPATLSYAQLLFGFNDQAQIDETEPNPPLQIPIGDALRDSAGSYVQQVRDRTVGF